MQPYKTLNDEELVCLLHTCDKGAFQEIYLRYWKGLLQTASLKLHCRESAKEVVQDIFVELWERRNSTTIEHLKSYLYTAVKYKVINQIRNQSVRLEYANDLTLLQLSTHRNTEEQVAYEELFQALRTCMKTLPQKTRIIFELSRIEGKPATQIAKDLNIPLRTVEYHLTQAVRAIRLHLKEYVMGICILYLYLHT